MPTRRPAEMRLRFDSVRGAMARHDIETVEQLAERIGVSHATAKRVMGGHQAPSATFIAGLRVYLGLPFDMAVEAVDPTRKPATSAA